MSNISQLGSFLGKIVHPKLIFCTGSPRQLIIIRTGIIPKFLTAHSLIKTFEEAGGSVINIFSNIYNWSFQPLNQDYDIVPHTTYVVCLSFYT